MTNDWLVFEFLTTHEAAFPISHFLEEAGSCGIVTIDKTDFLKSFQEQQTPDAIIGEFLEELSFDVKLEAYFSFTENKIFIKNLENQIHAALARIAEFCEIGKGYLGYHLVKEEDWANNWKAFYQTIKINQIVINPSWIPYQAKDNEIVIRLDPGSAFGTGSHETTALILELLTDMTSLNPQTLLDLGTGSGILAIAAKKLFPDSEITAVDIDENAILTARENASNNLADIDFKVAELKDCQTEYDLILANLIAKIHLDLAELYPEKLSPEGILLVSGIIADRAEEVRQKLCSAGFLIEAEQQKNDWIALRCRKSGH